MRLEPLEVYILECFRQRRTTELPLSEIVGDSTVNRYAALGHALRGLEYAHHMLQRGRRRDIFALTELGKRYTRMF